METRIGKRVTGEGSSVMKLEPRVQVRNDTMPGGKNSEERVKSMNGGSREQIRLEGEM